VKVTSKWPTAPLGDVVVETQYGTSLKANEQGAGVPVLRMNNITYSGALDLTDMKHVEMPGKDFEQYSVRRGDLLFNRTNSQELVGKMGVWNRDEQVAFAGYLVRLRLKRDRADPAFVAAWFNTTEMKTLLRTRAKPSINMSNINATEVLKFPVVLPPLAEQRRIAEVLDRAEALRAKRRAALAQLDSLTQSLFLDLFGDDMNSKKWPVRAVADYVREFQGGKSIESESGENVTTRNRVLKVSAVTGMKFLAHESKPVPDSYKPPKEHFAKPGDLLFSRANTTELVGAVAYVESTPPNLLLPDKLWRFVWRDPAAIEPLFVWALFQTPTLRREIGRRATGTSGSMKNISQEKVFGIRTILPPIELQREFARRVTAVEALKTAQRASLAELDALFATLQHRAFRGEL
jgi:type I restriction enzyme S subunit